MTTTTTSLVVVGGKRYSVHYEYFPGNWDHSPNVIINSINSDKLSSVSDYSAELINALEKELLELHDRPNQISIEEEDIFDRNELTD